MTWTPRQIRLHTEAAHILTDIMDEGFSFIRLRKKVTEYEVQQFLVQQLREHGLIKIDHHPLIVAFGPSSAIPHYQPPHTGSCILKKGDVIKIDIWARLPDKGAPYADITWMGVRGKPTVLVSHLAQAVFQSRDNGIHYVRAQFKKGSQPGCADTNRVTYQSLIDAGYEPFIKHSTGHVLGFTSPHGRGSHLAKRFKKGFVKKRVGYTIEPGIYFKGKYGFRSEINFYVAPDGTFVITTPLQRKLIIT